MGKQTEKCFGLVVLVPCPYQGHINPMLQLGTVLHSFGFSITVVHTIFNSPDPKNHPHFIFVPISHGLSDQDIAYGQIVDNIVEMNYNCKENFRHFLEKLVMNEAHGEKIRCIISDELMFYAEAVAVDLNLPSIILRTTSAATSYARCALVRFITQSSVLFEGSDSHDLVPELHPLRFKDLPFSLSKDFGKFAELMGTVYGKRSSSAIIWNTSKCLEELTLEKIQQQSHVPIFPIGPLHMIVPFNISSSLITEDRTCISWLDKQPHRSVIYVSSSGSIAALTEKEVAEIAWGLANSNQSFLWVVRPGSVCGSDWIELLPKGFQDSVGDKGCIVRWASQREVLAHPAVGGFWSHCGWNSTLESIGEGVPMLCKPSFGDQRVNARYVSYVWRVGLELEELERGEIERAVRRLILENEGNEMRERVKEMKKEIEDTIQQGAFNLLALEMETNFQIMMG
ncbi:UDP-glucose iridoid glucosyltransferase-like isoform X2 [Humulus lupulus]|uniref:UDP-glucose iridoid glucosyltransferase-like isoform X2 n=1 Tax=Humulus lupulus TaxID=3486 RepID=UPI002B412833|nr:UDP-glucose iridoid glucosyltransferase-like isoform X2 [Humulus lupulus]